MSEDQLPSVDPTAEGALARRQGRPKDACPYPLDSDERARWLEGFDGLPSDRAPDLPLDSG